MFVPNLWGTDQPLHVRHLLPAMGCREYPSVVYDAGAAVVVAVVADHGVVRPAPALGDSVGIGLVGNSCSHSPGICLACDWKSHRAKFGIIMWSDSRATKQRARRKALKFFMTTSNLFPITMFARYKMNNVTQKYPHILKTSLSAWVQTIFFDRLSIFYYIKKCLQ